MLVGRESELRTIGTLLAGARVGDSGVLVLSGEPGIGKTALLVEASTLVEDMRVLRVQGVESEQLLPFVGLLQLLRPMLGLLDQIPAPQSRALSSALLLESAGDASPNRFAIGAATLSLLCRAAEDRPLAVLVDDAHLLDSASAEALVFAARRLISDAVAFLVSARAGEPGATIWSPLPSLTVRGLDLDAAQRLLTRAGGQLDRRHLARLHRATGGNPLALLELGDGSARLDAAPPDSPLEVSARISRSFLGRVTELSDDARVALLVAAADGASAATVHAACAVLGLAEPRLSEAEDAGLIRLDGDRIEFRHPLVRSAVYGAAERTTRRAVHRALAAVVPETESDRLAWHLAESTLPPDESTAATLDRVAVQAASRGAYALAANAHERAASLTGTPSALAGRLAAAGEAAWLAGLTDRAMELLDRALTSRPEPLLRAHIQELRGAVETRSGSLDEALATLMGAAEAVEEASPDTAIRLFADAIHVSFYLGEPAPAMRACAAIDRLLTTSVDPAAGYLGSMASGMALVLSGAGASGIARMRSSAFALVVDDDASADRFRLPLRVQGALWLRDAGPHRDLIRDAVDRLREQAALGSLPYLLMHIARDGATTEHWDDAEAAYNEAIRLATEIAQWTDLAISLAGLASLNARQGREQACHANVASAADLCRRSHIRLGSFWLAFAQGDLASGLGDPGVAVTHYEALEAQLAETGLLDPDQSCAPELVEEYVHLGRLDDARRVASEFTVKAEAKGQPWSLARSERALGLCSPQPDAHFRASLELHARTLDRYEAARTELAFGAHLRRDRRRVDARPLLRSALRSFELLGAAPWADRADRELQATGVTVRRREASALTELTGQERQIAQLLARGRTTREAAAALFLSPKTVEYHLRHVYLKLDVRSRAELAELFGE